MTYYYDQRENSRGDVYILYEQGLFKTPVGEPVGISYRDAGFLTPCKTSGHTEDYCFLCDEDGKLETVLISGKKLSELQRRLEDLLRNNRRALMDALDVLHIQ